MKERLTELYTYRNAEDFICSDYVLINKDIDGYDDAITKLGFYEDVEEDLGINLFTIINALRNGVYALYEAGKEPAFIEPNNIYVLKDRLSVGFYPEEWDNDKFMRGKECRWGCPYKNYGKTWALTKDELEFERKPDSWIYSTNTKEGEKDD